MTPYEMLLEFHRTFDAGVNKEFSGDLVDLRSRLIYEEANEIDKELFPVDTIPTDRGALEIEIPIDRKKLTKELADLMYVTIGTAVTFGLPLEEVFREVHRSNMTKIKKDGTILRREDGKVLKPDTYEEANLDQFFED